MNRERGIALAIPSPPFFLPGFKLPAKDSTNPKALLTLILTLHTHLAKLNLPQYI